MIINGYNVNAKNILKTFGSFFIKSEEIKLDNITPADGQIIKRQSGIWVNVADPALNPYTSFVLNPTTKKLETYKGITLTENLDFPALFVTGTDLATILEDYATNSSIGTFIPIKLPSADSVSGRLVGLIEGVNYPTGWELTADGNDLIVTHGLNRHTKDVIVWSKNTLESINRKELGNAAYSGLYEPIGVRFDSVVIESLATILTEITIYITFQ